MLINIYPIYFEMHQNKLVIDRNVIKYNKITIA